MPPNLGLLKTKRGKATLPLPSACRIELLSSFHFPPCATPCLVDVKVYVFRVNALDEALATRATTIAAAGVMARHVRLAGVIRARQYPSRCDGRLVLVQLDELARLDVRQRAPGVPGDLEDHHRDRKADDRITDRGAERNDGRAPNDAQRDEAINPGMVAVSDQRRARQSLPRPQTHLCGQLVSAAPDDPSDSEHPQMRQLVRVDQSLNRL